MSTLASISGLSLAFDEDKQYFMIGEDVFCGECNQIKLNELIPTLLNKSLKYPENVYTCHKNVVKKEDLDRGNWPSNLKYDVFVLPYGLLGIEYIKTHIYYTDATDGKYACIIEVLLGELKLVMQKNIAKGEYDFDTYVEEAIVVDVHAGEKIIIPSGYMFTFVNSTSTTVVFAVVWSSEHIIDYRVLSREQGLGYFLIAKNARTEIVSNPRYRNAPEIVGRNVDSFLREEINSEANLYDMVLDYKELVLDYLY